MYSKKPCRSLAILMLALMFLLPFGHNGLATTQSGPTEQQIVLTQFDGSTVTLSQMPESICAHSYGLALILHELGLNVTSVMTTSRPLPEALKQLPSIGNPRNPDYELIKSLDTDLLVASSTFKDSTAQFLSEQQIPACYLDISLYSDTRRNIEMLGDAFGKTEEKERLLKDIDEREQAVLSKIGDQASVTVAIILGTGESFLFQTPQSYIGEMVSMMGLTNIVENDESGNSTVPFSVEQLVALDPDILIRCAHGSNWSEVEESFNREFAQNQALSNLSAVKSGRVYDLEAELFTANAGTRSIESFETLAQTLFSIQ